MISAGAAGLAVGGYVVNRFLGPDVGNFIANGAGELSEASANAAQAYTEDALRESNKNPVRSLSNNAKAAVHTWVGAAARRIARNTGVEVNTEIESVDNYLRRVNTEAAAARGRRVPKRYQEAPPVGFSGPQ
jgi:hypothetical protein